MSFTPSSSTPSEATVARSPSFLWRIMRKATIASAFGGLFIGAAVLYQSRNVSIIDPPPDTTLARVFHGEPTYVDCYEYIVRSERIEDALTKDEALVRFAKAFLTESPSWVRSLLEFRDRVAQRFDIRPSGLDTAYVRGTAVPASTDADRQHALSRMSMSVGDGMGQFRVLHRTSDSVLLGSDDKHLDFRIMLSLRPVPPPRDARTQALVDTEPRWQFLLGTSVRVHNWLGYAYLVPVLPVHMVLSRLMLQSAVDHLVGPYSIA